MPIAIQLKQIPADDNPIFFPTDSEYDWLTAKIFVRSADFNDHQLNAHLLRTHLLAEVFAVSLLRNVPMVHPLYKLLVPHTRYTLQINKLARGLLISDDGFFIKFAASGGEGCIPNFYYRDDGIKLWDIIRRFVKGVLSFYDKNDTEVQKDSALQKWISDIFEHEFLSQTGTGIPQSFTTVAEMVKFVTMVIFTCSGQHSAVNTGQFDYGGWMPNTPTTLEIPPPTEKGTTNEATMLQAFPNMGIAANGMAAMWLLSRPSYDSVPLGQYPEQHFSEETPCDLIMDFQGELQILSENITNRNKNLEVPYTYLDPKVVENSVSL
ncbi:hypothetical protein VZT92_002907 [Zoarces viviparus]|uniref:Lipoxygenase domain-containing protein n=1 Tax=Zoarces viviparus TaxID=48416 RepID=A0AAW1FZX2_ZOAVI